METGVRRASIAGALAAGLLACSGSHADSAGSGSDTGSTAATSVGNGSSGSGSGGTSGGSTTGSGSGGVDTWTSWASPDFFKLYCVSCHSAGGEGNPAGSNLDWTSYADVQMNANDIRCGVAVVQDPSWNCPSSIAAQQFPIGNGPKPAETDRIRLVNWIDAGVPE